jgi:hypothetical protein
VKCPHCKEPIQNKCKHCGRKWEPRKDISICPDCKRSDWNEFPSPSPKGHIGRPVAIYICTKTCEHPHSEECDVCSKSPNYSHWK